ncbi:8652_t:CDS:2 [Ambispora gerdemannii]|uniref:8652_t:CDS:1 n=1 Tax=Ambispora gerdemannii TaxID=144530 RepID=A0A9N9DCX0_9GLOM|nr:8652_t:CDS:2 [Ambispora gerdemannii]
MSDDNSGETDNNSETDINNSSETNINNSSETNTNDHVDDKIECASPAPSTPESVVISTTLIPLTTETRKELKAKILRQVEYYFSTENLREDYYLNKLRWSTDEEWVPIDEICGFQRMQKYTDHELIVEALRESSKLLEVNEDGTSVRRSPSDPLPLPEEVLNGHLFRSVYMVDILKGFTISTSLNEIEGFLKENNIDYKEIKRRLNDEKEFKGSVFIEFDDRKSAEEVVKKELKYKDEKLLILLKWDYCHMKINEKGLPPNTMRHQCEKQFYTKKRKRLLVNIGSRKNRQKIKTTDRNRWTRSPKIDDKQNRNSDDNIHIENKVEVGDDHNEFGVTIPPKIYSTVKFEGPKIESLGVQLIWVYYPYKDDEQIGAFDIAITNEKDSSSIVESLEEDESLLFEGVKPTLTIIKDDELREYKKLKHEKFNEISAQREKILKTVVSLPSNSNKYKNNQNNIKRKHDTRVPKHPKQFDESGIPIVVASNNKRPRLSYTNKALVINNDDQSSQATKEGNETMEGDNESKTN